VFHTLSVGNSLTRYLVIISALSAASESTVARGMPWVLSVVAAFLNSGDRFKHFPHDDD